MEIEVSDAEYETLRSLAFADDKRLGNPYDDIITPDWVMDRVKSDGKLSENGIISYFNWYDGEIIY